MPPVGFEPTISAGERPQAAHLLRSWVRTPPGAWIFVWCECRVLSGRGLCDELITRPEESYRLWYVVVCDLETSKIGAPYIYDINRLRVSFYPKFLLKLTFQMCNVLVISWFWLRDKPCKTFNIIVSTSCVFFYFNLWVTAARQPAAPPPPLGCAPTYNAAPEVPLAGHPSYAVSNFRVFREQWIGCSVKESYSRISYRSYRDTGLRGQSKITRNLTDSLCYGSDSNGWPPEWAYRSETYFWTKLTSVPVHVVKAYWVMEVKLHSFLTSALDGDVWLPSHLGCFATG